MVSEFPQEIFEALKKQEAASTTATLKVHAFYLGTATLPFSSTVCIIQAFRGEKIKMAIRKLSEKMGEV